MSAAQPPKRSIAPSASHTPGFGRLNAAATLRASVPVMTMPAIVMTTPMVWPALTRPLSRRGLIRPGRGRRRGAGSDDGLGGRAREVARSVGGDDEHVLEPNTADVGVVDARLHGHDVADRERRCSGAPDARRLVDLEADAVACAVDEAARHGIVHVVFLAGPEGVVARRGHDVLDELVDLAPWHARTSRPDPLVLGLFED